MASKKKLLTSGVAIVAAVGVLFGGTFAWQSISQSALNEVSASVNPGGRLHDDFVEITYDANGNKQYDLMTYNKDVYVENFTELSKNGVQVFARVRLDEYMELGQNAGKLTDDGKARAENNKATALVAGTDLVDKSTWSTYKFGDDSSAYRKYWNMDVSGGQTTYMPTFNKNKDSLEADINGSSAAGFKDYVDYTVETERAANAIYDADAEGVDKDGNTIREVDEVTAAGYTANDLIAADETKLAEYLSTVNANGKEHIKTEEETHTATKTLNSFIISMDTYMECLEAGYMDNNPFDGTGEFWVYDNDGWAYWANPIDPETATGLLLNGISRTEQIINQDWYYAINVVAQFVTGDDLGQTDNTGFYDKTEGSAPTENALLLLNTIGVDVQFDVDSAEGLETALAHGGVINVTEDLTLTKQLDITADCVLNLGENTISGTDIQDWDAKVWSLLSVQNGATVVINSGTFEAKVTDSLTNKDSYCVDVRDGSRVVINGGKFIGNVSAVYVHTGEAVITGGEFSIDKQNSNEPANAYILNCYDANYQNGTAKITVTGGSFENFNPDNCKAEGANTSFVPGGYYSFTTDNGGTYTVSKTVLTDNSSVNTVSDAEELETALANGGTINVADDITLTRQLEVKEDCVLNLGEHTISGTNIQDWDAKVWSLLSVQNGATVVINSGTFEAKVTDSLTNKDSYCVDVRDGSKVVINGGKFVGNVTAVYVHTGEAVITGGEFSIDKQNSNEPANAYILNCYDANYQNGTAKITVTGGSFVNFDPANCKAEGANTSFVAEGYTSAGSDGTYTVSKA